MWVAPSHSLSEGDSPLVGTLHFSVSWPSRGTSLLSHTLQPPRTSASSLSQSIWAEGTMTQKAQKPRGKAIPPFAVVFLGDLVSDMTDIGDGQRTGWRAILFQLRSLGSLGTPIRPYRESEQIWAGREGLTAKRIRSVTKQMFCQNDRNVTLHFLFL